MEPRGLIPRRLEPRTNKVGYLNDGVVAIEDRIPQEYRSVLEEEDIGLESLGLVPQN